MIRPVLEPSDRHPITITPHEARVIVTRGGRTVADTSAALRLEEASYRPVLYVPREDADLTLLEPTRHTTYCPYKGDASYFTITAGDEPATNAVWSYEDPHEAMTPIAKYLAFYPQYVEIRVEPAR
jgi:uncharacterized protein (DUF427 family)